MRDLFGPAIADSSPDDARLLFELDGWPLIYVDDASVAVNDLRSSVAFAHRVWLQRTAPKGEVRAVPGATPVETLILIGDDVVAVVVSDPARPTHANVIVIEPATGATLLDRDVRYRQLPPARTGPGNRGV